MKFLLVVLAIHLLGELISKRRKDKSADEAEMMSGKTYHPAEFELRPG